MSLATVLPRSSVRILVHGHLAARRRACVDGRGDIQCSRHRVTPLRRVPIPVSIAIGVSVPIPVLSAVGLSSTGASPGAVRMSGLPVIVLRSDFAML